MSIHSSAPLTFAFSPIRLAVAATLTGLIATASACSSDSKSSSGSTVPGSTAGDDGGGTTSSSAGTTANDAGTSSHGGTGSNGAAGDGTSGGSGGATAGATSTGGSASGGGGSGTAGSGGGGTLPGDDVWACVAAGTSCICQNNANPKDASTCSGTYKCCFAVPLGPVTRCQCQDPGTSKCSDLAGAFGDSGKVVDHCPP